MRIISCMFAAASLAVGALAQAQGVPPVDHIVVNDPRIFDLSDAGLGYSLIDGPVATAALSVVQGPRGALAATIVVQDDHLNSWGPVALAGKVAVKGTLPLSMRLAGGGAGQAKVRIAGTYDASVNLMRVIVSVRTPEKLKFQWNDSFVPDHADETGTTYSRLSVATNFNNIIKGDYTVLGPGINTTTFAIDRESINSNFQVRGAGLNVIGNYNGATTLFSVSNARTNIGYGPIFTPGSLVTVTSDNLFPRIF